MRNGRGFLGLIRKAWVEGGGSFLEGWILDICSLGVGWGRGGDGVIVTSGSFVILSVLSFYSCYENQVLSVPVLKMSHRSW